MLKQLLFHTDRKCLYKFIYNLGFKGLRSFNRFRKQSNKEKFFPAFHFISVTDDCNLSCIGCWIPGKTRNSRMDPENLDRIINEIKKHGSYFFGILGGEPLLYKPLFDVLEKHKDCYFQLFTNGTLLSETVAGKLKKLGNITPVISFEGDQEIADIRRGGTDIYRKTREAISNAVGSGLITGVAMSVCKTNLNLALSEEFIQSLIKQGVIYLWYYIYRPMGKNASPELCLSKEEIMKLRLFLVERRKRFDIIIVDTYWDQNGNGLCPAASGLSHHINAEGFVEPCPVIQFAANNIEDGSLSDIYNNSDFLSKFRSEIPQMTSGCIVMENPGWLAGYARQLNARDTSGRGNEAERLLEMPMVCSHGSIDPVPERSRLYKFAKKHAFFGLGAYG